MSEWERMKVFKWWTRFQIWKAQILPLPWLKNSQSRQSKPSWLPCLQSGIAWDRGTKYWRVPTFQSFFSSSHESLPKLNRWRLARLTEINGDYPGPGALCNCKVRKDWLNATGPKPLLGGYCYLDVLTGLHFPGLLCHSSWLCRCAQANASPPFP